VYDRAVDREPRRVLIVEDEPDVARLLSYTLTGAGFAVQVAASVGAAIAKAKEKRPEVIVLDLMLLDGSGVDVCKALRADPETADVGILMLTALGGAEDRIGGLEAGADDYVVKPFVVREVVLRVTALATRVAELRAHGAPAPVAPAGPSIVRCGAIELDVTRHVVTAAGHEVQLRPLEFKLLALLVANPGRVFSREELLAEVWGLRGDLNTRTVDVHVRRLRMNLGAAADAIETVHGFGYRARADGA
jgi:two-component system, OmpR family, phosphate regulon response regulator PhoB